jgi:hypothetical protein
MDTHVFLTPAQKQQQEDEVRMQNSVNIPVGGGIN